MLPAQQLYPAQSTLAQIRRDRLVTHIRLYRAGGGAAGACPTLRGRIRVLIDGCA